MQVVSPFMAWACPGIHYRPLWQRRRETPPFLAFFFGIEREAGKNNQRQIQEKHANTSQERTKGMTNSNRERKRILLVDDEVDARDLAELTLAEYTLTCARDFDGGLLAARRGYFDLYILDNWLPGGSGVELCRLICGFDPYAPIDRKS